MTVTTEKPVMVVAMDDSEHSFYALEWALDHLFTPYAPNYPFHVILLHAKPISTIGFSGPGMYAAESMSAIHGFVVGNLKGAAAVLLYVDVNFRKIAARIIEKAKEACLTKLVTDVAVEVMEGNARNVICEAVERHHASMLVVGSHGYGAITRAVLGSVSDHCAYHANCSVMIVKRPNIKR